MSAPLAFYLTHIVNETEMNSETSEHADKLTPEKQSGDGNEKEGTDSPIGKSKLRLVVVVGRMGWARSDVSELDKIEFLSRISLSEMLFHLHCHTYTL